MNNYIFRKLKYEDMRDKEIEKKIDSNVKTKNKK